MEPMQRIMVIRLLEKIRRDEATAERLQIANVSKYRKEEKKYESFMQK